MSNAEGPLILRGTARFLHEAVGSLLQDHFNLASCMRRWVHCFRITSAPAAALSDGEGHS